MTQPDQPSNSPFGPSRQNQVYAAGLQGQLPQLPVSPEDLAAAAERVMSPEVSGYLDGMPSAMRANRAAFEQWHIVPRTLRDVSERDLSVELFGKRYVSPVLLAPIGVQSIVHPQGEVAVGRAAASLRVPMVFSTASSYRVEEVAGVMGDAPRWFQLYYSRSREFNASMIRRAEAAGCEALVVTLDTVLLAWRTRDIQNAYLPFLRGIGIANYLSDPAFQAGLAEPVERNPQAAIQHFLRVFSYPSLNWDDVAWLREQTRLPLILKGVLHPDDARRAVDSGVNGVIVSNHGGRQVEGVIPSLQALPGVVDAVGDRVPVLLDSGVRRASDVVKACALGARAVLLGRPYLWGLALNGEEGVREVLENLLADLDLTLALTGHSSFAELTREVLRPA